jgi:transcriptional regulator with XRE-family HTH domain
MAAVSIAVPLGKNIRRLREATGDSQETLAHKASLHRTVVTDIENGHRVPRAPTILKLAGALGVDPGEFFAGMQWVSPKPAKPGHFDLEGAG